MFNIAEREKAASLSTQAALESSAQLRADIYIYIYISERLSTEAAL
jgi:hypothetical protein